jgi:ABC-type nitrate/sulfonate/bicarbonate transport system substrate-binding protein
MKIIVPRKNRSITSVAAAMLIVAFAVGSGNAEAQNKCDVMKNITFGAPTATISIGQYPLVVALANGYFKEECINLTIQGIDGSARAAQLTAVGKVDLGSSTSETFLQLNQEQGTPLVWFYQELRQPTSRLHYWQTVQSKTSRICGGRPSEHRAWVALTFPFIKLR